MNMVSMLSMCLFTAFWLGAGNNCAEKSEVAQGKSLLLAASAIQPKRMPREEIGESFSLDDAYKEFVELERSRGNESTGMEPMMTKKEIQLLNETLSQADAYLEFGIGGSTTIAAKHRNLQCLKCIESSEDWIQLVSEQPSVSNAIAEGRLELVFVDIGSTKSLSYPRNKKHISSWPNYSGQTFGSCGIQAKRRVVLVDGRFRVACFLKMLTSISSMGWSVSATQLLIHDYERSSYHVVEEFADVIEIPGENSVAHVCSCGKFVWLNRGIKSIQLPSCGV